MKPSRAIMVWSCASSVALLLGGAWFDGQRAEASEPCLAGGVTPTGKPCSKAKSKTKKKEKRGKKRKSCKAGQVRNEDTAGYCCWPGQGWAGGCVGKPTECPGDLVRDGEACGCPSGKMQDGTACNAVKVPPGMVEVPAGKFPMGSSSGQDDEKPVHEVYVSGFLIDKYEVTVDEYKRCVEAGGCSTPKYEHNDAKSKSKYKEHYNYGASGRGKHPINGVDWHQAKAYCAWVGKRLPTEAEWEKAARGTDGRKYPWGDGAVGGGKYGNFADETAKRVYGDWDIVEGYEDGYVGTAPVGSYPSGVSPYGVHDMAGNVWEWTADWYEKSYYGSSPPRDPKGPTQGSARVFRGGSWYDTGASLRAAIRATFPPGYAYADQGFRCVRSLP